MKLYVRSAMSICTKASRAFWTGVGMDFIKIALWRALRSTLVPTPSP